jgi:hypothetical protein
MKMGICLKSLKPDRPQEADNPSRNVIVRFVRKADIPIGRRPCFAGDWARLHWQAQAFDPASGTERQSAWAMGAPCQQPPW